jgi:hypothetical protein
VCHDSFPVHKSKSYVYIIGVNNKVNKMLQEDSNGEASFEIIDKKNEESSNNGDKTGDSS